MPSYDFAALRNALYAKLTAAGVNPIEAMGRAGVGAAVALAESGGRTEATNKSVLENSVGPWQINLMAHPDVTEECARDLVCAAEKVVGISNRGENWNPWTVFTSGAYKKYLPNVGPIPGVPGASGSAQDTVPAIPVVGGVTELANRLGTVLFDQKNWWRLAFIAGGGAAIYVGARMYLRESPRPEVSTDAGTA